MYRAMRRDRKAWPSSTLLREEPSTAFYPFEPFINVFPAWLPGAKIPVKIPEKLYGPPSTRGSTMGESQPPVEHAKVPPGDLSARRSASNRIADRPTL